MIVCIAVGLLCVKALIGIVVYLVVRRRRSNRNSNNKSGHYLSMSRLNAAYDSQSSEEETVVGAGAAKEPAGLENEAPIFSVSNHNYVHLPPSADRQPCSSSTLPEMVQVDVHRASTFFLAMHKHKEE